MKAIVNTTVCPLKAEPKWECTLVDEALYGMVVDILEEPAPGWAKVRTHYRYEGFAPTALLRIGDEGAFAWESLSKRVVRNKNCCDVLSLPRVQGVLLQSLTRGGVLAVAGEAENGWQKVRLADGREGYVQASILDTYHTSPCCEGEAGLRRAIAEAAMLYQGTHYRWGGKSPLGIDCSGLASMAYMLCGILIYRDANIVEGFPIHEIPRERMQTGDLLFFPGHVAVYLGEGRYCHSTGKAGADGFTVNSLNPGDPDFRKDLAERLSAVGSYFQF